MYNVNMVNGERSLSQRSFYYQESLLNNTRLFFLWMYFEIEIIILNRVNTCQQKQKINMHVQFEIILSLQNVDRPDYHCKRHILIALRSSSLFTQSSCTK